MKNLKILFRVFAFLTLLSVASCTGDVEPIDPYVLDPNITECPAPTSFTSSDFVETKVTLTWVSEGDLWEVEYGPAGFVQGQGTTVSTSEHSIAVDGLDPTAEYDFYVRTDCGDLTSDWLGPISVNDTVVVDPNPNPQTGSFTVDFDGDTYVATNVQAMVNSTAIAITALRAPNGDIFQLTLPAPLNHEGTFNWDIAEAQGAVIALAYSANSTNAYISGSDTSGDFAGIPGYTDTATITISEIDTINKTISGTFQFTGGRFDENDDLETKTFINGAFNNISYEEDITNPGTDNEFFAKLDGVDFIPTFISGMPISDLIYIEGKKAGVENITVVVPNDIAPGTYEMGMFGDYMAIYVKDMTSTGTFNADPGSVTIISHDTVNKRIKGTFNFTGTSFFSTDTHEITQGTFDVSY